MKKRLTILMFILFCSTLTLSAQGIREYSEHIDSFKKTSFQDDAKKKVLKLYPVPATRQISFELRDESYTGTYIITIYNFLGKAIDKITGFHDKKTLNLSDYYSGIYIYQLRDKRGHLIESGKFNVVKQ